MECEQKTLILISRYANGEATQAEKPIAVAHLAECPSCRARMEEWRSHREILEWAYHVDVPEEVRLSELLGSAKEVKMFGTFGRKVLQIPAWTKVGAVAAALLLLLLVRFSLTSTQGLTTGKQIATDSHSSDIRAGSGVKLKLGPGSAIRQVQAGVIQLEKGWVRAEVRHGTGLRILTSRLEVLDRGTVFQVVTGREMDYVMVDEGSVTVSMGRSNKQVKAGEVLVARDKEDLTVASMPKPVPEKQVSTPQIKEAFSPKGALDMDWDEGISRLNPTLGLSAGAGSSGSGTAICRHKIALCSGVKNGLREHFEDIVVASSGGQPENPDWEIPAFVLMVDGISSSPELPADVYLVSLHCQGGNLRWRFTGSKGAQAFYPFGIKKPTIVNGSSSYDQTYSCHWKWPSNGDMSRCPFSVRLLDWPGDLKPTLDISLKSIPRSQGLKEENAVLAKLMHSFPQVKSFGKGLTPTVLYMEQGRRHRFAILWNDMAGADLCRIRKSIGKTTAMSVDIGAILTDLPVKDPNIPEGLYLIRAVKPAEASKPHLELVDTDSRIFPLSLVSKTKRAGEFSRSLDVPRGCEPTWPAYSPGVLDGDAFPMGFMIGGNGRDRTLVEGWIRVSKP